MRILSLLLILSLAACNNVVREEGVISLYENTEEVVFAPETVQAGRPFSVTVQTFGDGCVEASDMEVTVTGNLAVLVPYDLVTIPSGDRFCPLVLKRPVHTAQITFEELGSATLRVKGMRRDNANPDGVMTTIEKTIQVE